MTRISVYPISTADCERGFSAMNLQHSDLRNRLKTETVNSLLTISINGPPVQLWKCSAYVLSWLKNGRRGATSKLTGKERKEAQLQNRHKLFVD